VSALAEEPQVPPSETSTTTHGVSRAPSSGSFAALLAAYRAKDEHDPLPPGTYELEVVQARQHSGRVFPLFQVVSGRWEGHRIHGEFMDGLAAVIVGRRFRARISTSTEGTKVDLLDEAALSA
jgi:hypothetical protein